MSIDDDSQEVKTICTDEEIAEVVIKDEDLETVFTVEPIYAEKSIESRRNVLDLLEGWINDQRIELDEEEAKES